jgi:hypothetical protein
MRRVSGVATLVLLCAAATVLRAGTVPTSIDIRCGQDAPCRDDFKRYVKKAIEDSGTHAFVDDESKATLRVVLHISKDMESGSTRGYAVAFALLDANDTLMKMNTRYCKTAEVEAIVSREIREFILK